MKKLALSLVLTLGVSGLVSANNGTRKNQLKYEDQILDTNTIEDPLSTLNKNIIDETIIASKEIENCDKTTSYYRPKPITEEGFAWIDTPSRGTCLTYGVWIHGDNGVSIFIESSTASLYTMGLPKCAGDGNYLV